MDDCSKSLSRPTQGTSFNPTFVKLLHSYQHYIILLRDLLLDFFQSFISLQLSSMLGVLQTLFEEKREQFKFIRFNQFVTRMILGLFKSSVQCNCYINVSIMLMLLFGKQSDKAYDCIFFGTAFIFLFSSRFQCLSYSFATGNQPVTYFGKTEITYDTMVMNQHGQDI